MPDGYMIVAGTKSKAYLYYYGSLLTALPVQSDMRAGRVWIRPGNDADILKPAKFVDSPSGFRFGYGGMVFNWSLQNMSPKMVNYIQTTYFGGNYSDRITVQTFNRSTGNWEVYNTVARLPDVTSEAEPAAGGYNNYKIAFANSDVAPDGFNLVPSIAFIGDIIVGVDFELDITVTNAGDDSTFTTATVVFPIPTLTFLHALIDNVDWTVEYSTNGGTVYSGTPPVNLATVTHLRYQCPNIVDAGDVYPLIKIELQPDTHGNTSATATVSAPGELETGDNTVTENFTVIGRGFDGSFDLSFG